MKGRITKVVFNDSHMCFFNKKPGFFTVLTDFIARNLFQ